MSNPMDFNVQTESVRGAIAIGGATVSAVTLNEVVTILTAVYLIVMLLNATPKLYTTIKHWRQVYKARKASKAKRGD